MQLGILTKGRITNVIADGVEVGFISECPTASPDKRWRWKVSDAICGQAHYGYAATKQEAFGELKDIAPVVVAEKARLAEADRIRCAEYASWPLGVRLLFDAQDDAQVEWIRASAATPFNVERFQAACDGERIARNAFSFALASVEAQQGSMA